MKKSYENVSVKKLPGSEIEITGAISAEVFDSYRKKALKSINESVAIDGFRKGNIPEKVLSEKVGEKTILDEMMELALSVAYPEIINDHKLDPIGHPRIQITKIAAGNPLEFVLTTAIMPEVILGDYKKIAKETSSKKIAEPKVEDKEVADAIEYIKKNDNHDHSHDKGHDHDHAHDHAHPEIDTPEFKDKIKNALIEEKKREAREKKRIEIAENISSASTVELPKVLIDSEVRRIEAQFKEDITRMGSKIEDYLAQAEKTIEEMRAEWKPHAEKKARLQIILNQIADKEKIVVSDKEIENEVNHILEHYKDADKEKARIYAVGVLTNEKVFEFLEAQKL